VHGNISRELSWTMCRLLVASGATGNRGNQHAHPRAALRWRRGAGAQVPRPTSASSRWCSIETTIDPTQRLLVGVWRLYRDEPGQAHPAFLVEEGILIPDDLDVTDPEGHALVCAYVASHRSSATRRAFGRLRLLTRSQFVEQLLWRRAYKQRSLVVGFNLAIDLSRLASRCRAAKAGFVALLPAALRPTGDRETLPTTSADGMVDSKPQICILAPLATTIDQVPSIPRTGPESALRVSRRLPRPAHAGLRAHQRPQPGIRKRRFGVPYVKRDAPLGHQRGIIDYCAGCRGDRPTLPGALD